MERKTPTPLTVFDHSTTPQPTPEAEASSFYPEEAKIRITPHEGYREYFSGPVEPTKFETLFSDELDSADFPTVRFAEGWAYAEHALRNNELPKDIRQSYLGEAAIRWDTSCRMIRHVYDEYPGQFLLWPGTRWRYQLSLDTLPAMQAVIEHDESERRPYDIDLLRQSQDNTRKTLRILMEKHRGIVEYQSALLDDPSENARELLRTQGRLGSIIGIALEAASVHITQLAKPRYAITPASLRSEEAARAGADMLVWDSRNASILRAAQIKKRVDRQARKKYRSVPLICGVHHMRLDNSQPLLNTLEAIITEEEQKKLKMMGGTLLSIVHGNRSHGCSRFNPRIQQAYEARVHKKTVAA